MEEDKLGLQVGELLARFYGNEQGFVRAYNANSEGVFKKIRTNMKVVPFDLKARLDKTYIVFTTSESDGYTVA